MSTSDGSEKTGLRLKRQTGWFAAGQEVECALHLLSDAPFKLFMWLCLHAARGCGSLRVSSSELALALGWKEQDIHLALEELEQQEVCVFGPGRLIEITDRFWPYRRLNGSMANHESRDYVEQVKSVFLQRRCVQSSFTPADEKLALQFYRSGIPFIQIERAILLGAVRKYCTLQRNGGGSPICSLHYFADLLDEVNGETSTQYWQYVIKKIEAFELDWAGFSPKTLETKR